MRLNSRSSFDFPFLTSWMGFFDFSSSRAAVLNSLLTSFVLISLFGLLCKVNRRLSGVRFVLSADK